MRKVAITTLSLMFVFAAPALSQVPPASELPGQTYWSSVDQYGDDGEDQIGPGPVEEGIEDAGEDANDGATMEGVGAYVEALSNESFDPESPEQTDGAKGDQYEGESPLQSIEEGLKDAGENANGGADGTGAYVEALDDDNPATASTLPSEKYTELPDTGGFSPVLIAVAAALVVGGGLLLRFALSRR